MIPCPQNRRERILLYLSGFCMGAADLVPGISGGTVAFVFGFYEALLLSIKSINTQALTHFFRGRFRESFQNIAWQFLLILGLGMATATILLTPLINFILHHPSFRILLYSVFCGLIAASILYCVKLNPAWKLKHFFWLLAGVASAWILTNHSLDQRVKKDVYAVKIPYSSEISLANYLPDQQLLTGLTSETLSAMVAKGIISKDTPIFRNSEPISIDYFQKGFQKTFRGWFFFCGMIGVAAMLLPGVSGSYLLTILGAYPLVIGALADAVSGHLDHDPMWLLVSLGLGILVGAALFSRVVWWLLHRYHGQTVALLIGFMAGALRAIWPFWKSQHYLNPLKIHRGPQLELLSPTLPDLTNWITWVAIVLAVGAFIIFKPKQPS